MKKLMLILSILVSLLASCSNNSNNEEEVSIETPEVNEPVEEVVEEPVEESVVVEEPVVVEEKPKPEGVEEELELVTVSEFLKQQPVVVYNTNIGSADDNEVPFGFDIIKDNVVSRYELNEEVVGSISDFAFHTYSENEDKYKEMNLKTLSELYELSDAEVVDYVESTDNYKAVQKDRPYVIGLIDREVSKEERVFFGNRFHPDDDPEKPERVRLSFVSFVSEGDPELDYQGRPVEEYRELQMNKLRRTDEFGYYELVGLGSKGLVRVKSNVRLINDAVGTEGFYTSERDIKNALGVE